eukprot:TRINITY_DN4424_c0_g1_i1.p1 TRINITY_DN4424_c0_g1~~TRINITY_DN4424_c0_g1_i1.p1  ORF type:complete len:685 (+),score=149.47 TRINITY_DN4424_c0_g1_i1:225-2279(+)
MNASELESWRRRQEVERLRVLQLGDTLTPPKLPPKRPHLRSKGTFLLETDFDEVITLSHPMKKPPAPSPPSTPNSSEWDPRTTSTPESEETSHRAYHRDSFMSHRREHVAEQGGESSGETLSKFKTRSNPPSIEEDHIPHLEAKHLSHTEASVHLDWDQQLSHLPSSLQLNHSDTVKDILRRPSSGKKELSSPPPVAPKPPYNRTLSERLPKDPGSVKVPSLSSSSFNVSNTHPSGEATVLSSSSTHIHASKSTPSLNLSDSQVLLPRRKFSQQPDQYKRQQPISEIIPSSSFEKWKRSMDSLDGSACSSLSHSNRSSRLPPPCEIRTSKSGTLGPSSSNHPHPPYSLDDRSRIVHHHHSRTTSLDQSAQQQQNMSPPPKHFHSNSDSGLSSLGGRTSTMSPVSTISSVSSGSSVSSRASLRSASIVSSSTLPGDNLIQEEEDSERTKEDLSSSNSSPHLSFQSGHVKKQKRSSTFQEEIDCEKVFNLLLRSLDSLPEKPSLDSLQTLFFTSPYQKTLLDYVEGVLEIEVNELFNNSLDRATIDKKESVSNLSALSGSNGAADPSASSLPVFLHGSNFETLKAELLKKVDNKLNVLRSTQILLKEDITRNEELGQNIAGEVKGLLSPIEYDKFSLHIQEMDKITNLLLGLSGRLARVENNLLALSIDGTRSDEIYRIRSEEGVS